MRGVRRAVGLALAGGALFAGSLAAAGPAGAASSPIEACGGGSYHVIDQHAIADVATVYLLYNGTTNCVVTWKTAKYAGKKTLMYAHLVSEHGAAPPDDEGNYAYYAGPVKVSAAHDCVDWGGASDPGWNVWVSGYSHCG